MEKKDKLTSFINRAEEVHRGENLDYSQVNYVNNRTNIKIIDHDLRPDGTEYGEYWQTPYNHLRGQGHPDKRGSKISLTKRSKQEDIIRRFKEVHKGENLDYSEVKYVNMHTKVKIISHDLRPDGTEYGVFWQDPASHLKGCTHPDIGKKKQIDSISYDTERFIKVASAVHENDDYSYNYVDYKGSQKKVTIFCNKIGANGKPHGRFNISPDAFIQGKGCPICGNHLSNVEDEIADFIAKLGFDVKKRDKTILCGKEIDIYVPEKNFAIEFDGLRWHSEEFNKDKYYHINKTLKCKNKGITLIHIFEDEYIFHKALVYDKIRHFLGRDGDKASIFARQCNVRKITNKEKDLVKQFEDKNHIQGSAGYSTAYGAFYNYELVGIMTFIKSGKEYELNRFCTDIRYKCPGIASKLFKTFIKTENPQYIKSFLDRRWCLNEDNNLYTKLGFILDAVERPDYSYTNGHSERLHKFGFRKRLLNRKYGFPLSMTENEMATKLGYYKIWNCGLFKYVWNK